MFKTGVYSIEQLRGEQTTTWFGRRKRVSIRLLNDVSSEEEYDCLFERITIDLADDRGANKRTVANRFSEFDELVLATMRKFLPEPNLRVHDVGVSNAQTSIDFFATLEGSYPDMHYLATDYDQELTIVHAQGLWVSLSASGHVVEVAWPPFVFTPSRPEHPLLYPLNLLICRFVQRGRVKRLVSEFEAGAIADGNIETVKLFSPKAIRKAANDSRFVLGTQNLLQPFADSRLFNCVRAMNVLNRNYFNDEQLQVVLQNIARSLEEGGLFVAGSNQNAGSEVLGGIYCFQNNAFHVVEQSGENPFLESQIDAFNRGTNAP